MADVVAITGAQRAVSDCVTDHMIVPPRPRRGVCVVCRTWTDPGLVMCANCTEVKQHLGTEPVPLDVMTLYSKPSAMRDILTRYKGRLAQTNTEDPFSPECRAVVEAMFVRYFHEHYENLRAAVGPIDAIVVVPSTTNPPPHPLHDLLAGLTIPVPVQPLLVRGAGPLGFRQPSRDGYRYTGKGPRRRTYLVDDVYTTGARINSAAYSLTAAGHTVVGSLVVARRINPDYHPQAFLVYSEQAKETYSWASSPILSSRLEPHND